MPNEERLKLIIFELQFCNTDRTYQLKLLKEAQDLAVQDHKQKVRRVIDKHTIKNADGEYYIACPPETLKKELELND